MARTSAVRVALVAEGGPCAWTDRRWETDRPAARIAWMLAVPELSNLPARPGLWSPVEDVRGPAGWPARRRTIRTAWRRWLLGPLPPPAAPTRTTLLGVT